MSHSHERGPIALDNCNLCIEHHLFNENGQRTSPTATFPTGSLSLSPLHYYLKPTTTVLLSFPLHSVVLFHCLVCVFSHSPWTVLTSSSSNNSCPWPRVPGKGAMNGLFLSPLFFCFEFQVFFSSFGAKGCLVFLGSFDGGVSVCAHVVLLWHSNFYHGY